MQSIIHLLSIYFYLSRLVSEENINEEKKIKEKKICINTSLDKLSKK